jgi:hypothetical protein
MISDNIISTVCSLALCFVAGAWIGRPMFTWLGAKTPFLKKG